jgi:tRNA threonylcarbamoyladenosine biosynthesis protein TsaE
VPVEVVPCGPEAAGVVHRLTQAAFAGYGSLAPPSGALRETVDVVRGDLANGGGAIAHLDGSAVGCLRWELRDDFHVRRVAVDPAFARRGVGRALMHWAEDEARRRGHAAVTVGVRIALPGNQQFYETLGYEVVGEHRHDGFAEPTWLALRKAL